MISTAAIVRARALVNRSLNQTATIEREVNGQDEYGAPTHERELVGTVACRVITAGGGSTGDAVTAGDRERLTGEYRLVLPHGTVIDSGYLVTVGGVRYRITRVMDELAQAVDVQAIMVEDD